MKYFLSIEFENQGEPTNYKIGDIITFISMKGLLKNGIIKEIKYMKDFDGNYCEPKIPTEYNVDCNGRDFIAVADYVLKSNAMVLNIKTTISEISESNQGFPLRT
jgi:hypothetical protein